MGEGMLKPRERGTTEYKDNFEPPQDWEELRDADGELMEGSYRTLPADDSDTL